MAIVGGVVGGLAASAAGASVLVAVGVGIASAVAVDYAMDAMMEDVAVDTMGGRNVNTKESTKAREIVYGEIRKGGNILWQDVAGTNNKYLYQITALAHDECQSIEKVYLDRELAWHNGTYQGIWANGNKLNIVVKDGDRAQSEISTGSSSSDTYVDYWVNNGTYKHRLQRIAYVWTRFEFDREKYPNGVPTVTALIKGRKVYDPRIYSHDPDDGDTWAFSNNPVLCLLDYLRSETYGAGISMDEFDESQIQDAANYCNNMVGTPSRKRYMCDGVVNTSQSIRQNIKNLLSCMNGRITYAGGKLRIEPYQYATPHSTPLNEDIITGNFTVVAKTPRQDNYNVVKGTYVSKHIDYIKTEYPQQDTSSNTNNYEDVDGGTHVLNLDLPFTTDTISAQRLAKLVLLRSRMQKRIKARLNAKGLNYRVGDNVSVTNTKFGIVDNVYEIINCTIGFDFESGVYVDIEARENSSEIYDHTASTDTEYVAGEVIELPKAPSIAAVDPSTIQAIAAFRFSENTEFFHRGIEITWSPPAGVDVDYYHVRAVPTGYAEPTRLDQREYEPYAMRFGENTYHWDVYVKVVNKQGVISDWAKKSNINVGVVDKPTLEEHYLVTDDIDMTISRATWVELTGSQPNIGSRLTLIEENEQGTVTDSRLYLWSPEFQVYDYNPFNTRYPYPDGAFIPNGTASVFDKMNIFWNKNKGLLGGEYNLAFSIHSTTYTSNCGANSTNCPITLGQANALGGTPMMVATLQLAPSFYNNATVDENETYALRVSVYVVVRATWGQGQTEDLPFNLSGLVRFA